MWLRILICLIIGFLTSFIIDLIANKLGLSNKEKRCLETGITVGILFFNYCINYCSHLIHIKMKSCIISFLEAYAVLTNDPFASKRTITTPNSPIRPTYNLPIWKVGEHKIHAKNEHDALKYAKKRGFWDGVSYPITIV